MVQNKIGKRLREMRRKKGLTQEEFAEMIGLSTNYISAVERGINLPSYEKLVEALNCLGYAADDVFCDLVDKSARNRACKLSDTIETLPINKQKWILDIVELLVSGAMEE